MALLTVAFSVIFSPTLIFVHQILGVLFPSLGLLLVWLPCFIFLSCLPPCEASLRTFLRSFHFCPSQASGCHLQYISPVYCPALISPPPFQSHLSCSWDFPTAMTCPSLQTAHIPMWSHHTSFQTLNFSPEEPLSSSVPVEQNLSRILWLFLRLHSSCLFLVFQVLWCSLRSASSSLFLRMQVLINVLSITLLTVSDFGLSTLCSWFPLKPPFRTSSPDSACHEWGRVHLTEASNPGSSEYNLAPSNPPCCHWLGFFGIWPSSSRRLPASLKMLSFFYSGFSLSLSFSSLCPHPSLCFSNFPSHPSLHLFSSSFTTFLLF